MGKVVVPYVPPWSFNKEVIVELDSVVMLVDVVIVVCRVPGVEFVCSMDPGKLLVSGEVGRVADIHSWVSDTDVLSIVVELLGSAAVM